MDHRTLLKIRETAWNWTEHTIILDEEVTKQLLEEFEIAIKNDEDSLSSSSEQWTDSYGIQPVEPPQHQSDHGFFYQQNAFHFDDMERFQYQQQLQQQLQSNELTQITPPQTPPMVHIKDDYIIQNLISQNDQQFQQQEAYDFNQLVAAASQTVLPALSPVTSEYIEYPSDVSHASPLSISDDDVAREMQIVDDIVRSRAQDLPDNWNDDEVSSCSFMDEDSSWEPTSPSFDGNSSIGSPSSSGKITSGRSSRDGDKKRTRPYGRGPEERKSRKKEQNKNAATRYRQKKKDEMKHVLDEESVLAEKHDDLAKKVSDFENEVKYLKKLIREFYKNK